MTRMTDERLAELIQMDCQFLFWPSEIIDALKADRQRVEELEDELLEEKEKNIASEYCLNKRAEVAESAAKKLAISIDELEYKMATRYWDKVAKDNIKLKQKAKDAEARLALLERGEYICKQCGLRKDAEFTPGDF